MIELRISHRRRILGGHTIRRLLPARSRQRVGPFIFFDHIGPEDLPPDHGVDVPPHPHIHLATVTYLFEGELDHRDSLGSFRTIRPGDINWMHAGGGIVHSERTGPQARSARGRIHGIQLWVALPEDAEETAPAFDHYPASALPRLDRADVDGRILVGSAMGKTSPVHTRSEALYVDLKMRGGSEVELLDVGPEVAAYLVQGRASVDGETLNIGELAVLTRDRRVLKAESASRVLLLGGAPIDGTRHMWWNFISSSAGRVEQARRDWAEGRFPAVPGEGGEPVPLPTIPSEGKPMGTTRQ